MENLPNTNEQLEKQLQETNHHLKRVQNLLIGILISTAIVAIFILILVTKLGDLGGGGGFRE
jgi:CHASE3 domain sensor protein